MGFKCNCCGLCDNALCKALCSRACFIVFLTVFVVLFATIIARPLDLGDSADKSTLEIVVDGAVWAESLMVEYFADPVLELMDGLNMGFVLPTTIDGVFHFNGAKDYFSQILRDRHLREVKVYMEVNGIKNITHKWAGKERTPQNYKDYQTEMAKALEWPDKFPNYPEKLTPDQLQVMFTTNTFFTMGLRSLPDGRVVYDATRGTKNQEAKAAFEALPDHMVTCKMYFSRDFSTMELHDGDKVYTPDMPEFDATLPKFMTAVYYYAQVTHATLHVYTYLMLHGANRALSGNKGEAMLQLYQTNILQKYIQVRLVLLGGKNWMIGGAFPADMPKARLAAYKIFARLGKAKTAREWRDYTFLSNDEGLINNEHVLPEVNHYMKLFEQQARKYQGLVSEAERRKSSDLMKETFGHSGGKGLHMIFRMFGYGPVDGTTRTINVNTFSQWMQCQGMAGVLHGSTLSMTRLTFTPYIRISGDFAATVLDFDPEFEAILGLTLLGLEEDSAILSSQLVQGTDFYTMQRDLETQRDFFLKKYWDGLTQEYQRKYGWFVSIWGPQLEHGTQLTVSTYV